MIEKDNEQFGCSEPPTLLLYRFFLIKYSDIVLVTALSVVDPGFQNILFQFAHRALDKSRIWSWPSKPISSRPSPPAELPLLLDLRSPPVYSFALGSGNQTGKLHVFHAGGIIEPGMVCHAASISSSFG
jgi:hypothetical protein